MLQAQISPLHPSHYPVGHLLCWGLSRYAMQRMSTDLRQEIISTSSENTEQLGKRIGAVLRGGETIQLISDLGGGKTTLTKGIVAGIGCEDIVSSPTFTVSKEYTGAALQLKHYDFYRLVDAGIMAYELQEDFSDDKHVTVNEWADIVSDILPQDAITINIEHTADETRHIVISAPQSRRYIVEALA